MKRNFSLSKGRMAEISQRLNRLSQKAKPRLQFPKRLQSKKHFFDYHGSNIVLGNGSQQQTPMKGQVRNTMDISDIQGAKPRMIEKQKNIMNYYRNRNEEHDPFAPRQVQIQKSSSQPKLSTRLRTQRQHDIDSLDIFQKQLETNRYFPNPESSKRQTTEPSLTPYHNKILADKLNIQSRKNVLPNNCNIFTDRISNIVERKGPSFNPTFLSHIFLQ